MPSHYGMKKPATKKGANKMPAAMMAKMKKEKGDQENALIKNIKSGRSQARRVKSI